MTVFNYINSFNSPFKNPQNIVLACFAYLSLSSLGLAAEPEEQNITPPNDNFVGGLSSNLARHCVTCEDRMQKKTGAFILEHGEQSLMSRAWLTSNAEKSIDVQYFIWTADNIGILATEALLAAAERGVKVRVIVDDLLVDVKDIALLALNEHPNISIKIYNPMHSVGVSKAERALNVVTDFRGANQRMHDKTAIFDGIVGITGGRNMADEYFDYDHEYNFRDRDILLMGKAVTEMSANFEEFWSSKLSVSVGELLKAKNLNNTTIQSYYGELRDYADDDKNFKIEARSTIDGMPEYFPLLFDSLVWADVTFISDEPGKNDNTFLLSGGGSSTEFLFNHIKQAKKSIFIQSPYLVMPNGGIELFARLVKEGVRVRISTNSLASTDNFMAFSGYHKQRKALIKAGVELFEFMPHPLIQKHLVRRYPDMKDRNPVFAIHAKSMVIDDVRLYIGTFNLDPRSANLNTEVGAFLENTVLAKQLTENIENDILPENSWKITLDFNPDDEVSVMKRMKLFAFKILPLKPVL